MLPQPLFSTVEEVSWHPRYYEVEIRKRQQDFASLIFQPFFSSEKSKDYNK